MSILYTVLGEFTFWLVVMLVPAALWRYLPHGLPGWIRHPGIAWERLRAAVGARREARRIDGEWAEQTGTGGPR